MNRTRIFLVLLVVAVFVVIGVKGPSKIFDFSRMHLLHDFMEYWAAGRLNLNGENPYSPSRLRELQGEAGLQVDMAIMMWNPPWTLSLVEPFGLMPARTGQIAWILVQIGLILFCSDRLWVKFGGDSQLRWVGWLMGATFAPTAFLIGTGQIAGFCLLGLTGFMIFEKKYPLAAGAFAALTAIKPHLLVVFALLLILQAFRSGHGRRVILGGLYVGLVAAIIPLLTNPQVYSQYLGAVSGSSSSDHKSLSQWEHPTLGSWLREATGGPFWVLFLPSVVVCAWAVRDWYLSAEWDWRKILPWVVLLSLIGAPYGTWPFDMVLLLVPLIELGTQVIGKGNRTVWIVVVWSLLNAVMLVKLFLGVSTPYYVWVVPTWFVVYLSFRRQGEDIEKL